MNFYITRKCGSMIFRFPNGDGRKVKRQVLSGEAIPRAALLAMGESRVRSMVAEGAFVAIEENAIPSDMQLGEPDVNPQRVGVGDREFMPEARALPGRRRDEALDRLLDEQEAKKTRTTIDEDIGGTPDGAIKVERPEEDEDEDDYDDEDLTSEERDAIEAIDRADEAGAARTE